MLLHLMHFLGVEVGRRILGAVHHAGLQCPVGLGEGHYLRIGAQRAICASSTLKDWMRIFKPLKSEAMSGFSHGRAMQALSRLTSTHALMMRSASSLMACAFNITGRSIILPSSATAAPSVFSTACNTRSAHATSSAVGANAACT